MLLIEIALQHKEADRARQYLDVMKQYFPSDSEISSLQDENSICHKALAPHFGEFLQASFDSLFIAPSKM